MHIDVMDGAFVPNLTFGAPVVKNIRKVTDLFFDLSPDGQQSRAIYRRFCRCRRGYGSSTRRSYQTSAPLCAIHQKQRYAAGVALNPASPLCLVEEILPDVDMVLLMSVNPGFGGQSFIETTVPKIARLRKMINDAGLNIEIQVDGGINDKTSKLVREAGATVLVAGSYVYGAADTKAAIASLKA